MPPRTLIAGNWKMNLTLHESRHLAQEVVKVAAGAGPEVMIAPPFTALTVVAEVLAGSEVSLGAQNCCWASQGAFTGEISPLMLRELGCAMVILGHSERRHVFGEDNAMINRRLKGALTAGLRPVFCVGETLEERQAGRANQVLKSQLEEGLDAIPIGAGLVVAYEPVWAIGTGQTATPTQAQEAHAFIRETLAGMSQKTVASEIRILYGGSVNEGNVEALLAQADINGALVGGAALKIESFARIIRHHV
ncbi:MAG: triose-phosphate isomerase [Desulfobacteraceae bacterium]|nr:triose-phosphate isomerase [Desulfobacteraceae bacterium]